MSRKESPLATVTRVHGSKEKLVASIVEALPKEDESEAELKERLLRVSNKKLLRLAESLRVVKDKYGDKDRLAEAVGAARGKAKARDYIDKLRATSVHRLLDMARSAS